MKAQAPIDEAYALYAKQDYNNSLALCEKIIKKQPLFLESLYLKGLNLLALKNYRLALEAFEKSLSSKTPAQIKVSIYDHMALCSFSLNTFDEAKKYYLKALEINPNAFEIYNNYGLFLKKIDHYDEAEKIFKKGLEINPLSPDLHFNLSVILKDIRRYNECLDLLNQTLLLRPGYYKALHNIASTYQETGRFYEAEKIYLQLIELGYEQQFILKNLSSIYFLTNRMTKGYENYEMRRSLSADFVKQEDISLHTKLWKGEDLKDKTLFIACEQGLGDEIMFANCFKDVLKQAKFVMIECDPRLRTIFARSFPKAMILARKA
jgi:tetratricopeptide (TPR) repeat protein